MQQRGEYLYAALGRGGFRVYDIANIDNKGFTERIVTGAGVAARPAALREDEVRHRRGDADDDGVDPRADAAPGERGGPIHPMYGYLYVADREEASSSSGPAAA